MFGTNLDISWVYGKSKSTVRLGCPILGLLQQSHRSIGRENTVGRVKLHS